MPDLAVRLLVRGEPVFFFFSGSRLSRFGNVFADVGFKDVRVQHRCLKEFLPDEYKYKS